MSDDVVAPQVPAAWYPDPERPARLRWWDGTAWTADTQELPPPPAAATARADHEVEHPAPLPRSRASFEDDDPVAPFIVRVDASDVRDVRPIAEQHLYAQAEGARPSDRVIAEARRRAARGERRSTALTYAPHTSARPASERDDSDDVDKDDLRGSPMTVEIWIMALLPLLALVAVALGTPLAYLPHTSIVLIVLVGAGLLVSLILASIDRATLRQRNHTVWVTPIAGLLPPVFLLARSVRVSLSSLLPLIAWLLVTGIVYATIAQSVTWRWALEPFWTH